MFPVAQTCSSPTRAVQFVGLAVDVVQPQAEPLGLAKPVPSATVNKR